MKILFGESGTVGDIAGGREELIIVRGSTPTETEVIATVPGGL